MTEMRTCDLGLDEETPEVVIKIVAERMSMSMTHVWIILNDNRVAGLSACDQKRRHCYTVSYPG